MLSLDGIKLSEFGMILQPGLEHPMTPTIINKTLAIPDKAGIYYFGSEIGERKIKLPLAFIDKNKVLNQMRIREFADFLTDSYGKPREIKLVFDNAPYMYYIVMLSEQIIPDKVYTVSTFTVPFVAYDPYKYSVIYADEVRWGSKDITFMSHYKLGHSGSDGLKTIISPSILNIYTDGLVNKPVIEITGSATNLVIKANGYEINLDTFTNTSWVIDCETYTVKKNGVNTFLANLRDFILLKGNNQVQISGTGINITIHIKLRDKYN